LALTFWNLIRPLLKEQKLFSELTFEHLKFKRNFSVFDALLNTGKSYNMALLDTKEIVLGNRMAPITILLITNPSCFYCRDAHTDIENILRTYEDKVNVIIRFNVPEDKAIISNRVAARLLEIYHTKGKIKEALDEVYDKNVNLEKWLIKWGAVSNDQFGTNILNKQKEWCHESGLNFTPAFFVNGKEFPKEYKRTDLKYFIDDLFENLEVKQGNLKEVQTVT